MDHGYFCRNCGKQLAAGQPVCNGCGVRAGTGYHFCPYCGGQTNALAVMCITCSRPLQSESEGRSRLIAGVLAILLGGLGMHNFYLGFTSRGVAQLLVATLGSLLTCGIAGIVVYIWALVEGVQILSGVVNADANGFPLKQ